MEYPELKFDLPAPSSFWNDHPYNSTLNEGLGARRDKEHYAYSKMTEILLLGFVTSVLLHNTKEYGLRRKEKSDLSVFVLGI